jgi:hypothetical protein
MSGCENAWCTLKHQSTNLRRQSPHIRIWRSRRRQTGLRVETYPYGGAIGDPIIDFRATLSGGRFGEIQCLLSLSDARALAEDLLYVAACAEEKALRARAHERVRAQMAEAGYVIPDHY